MFIEQVPEQKKLRERMLIQRHVAPPTFIILFDHYGYEHDLYLYMMNNPRIGKRPLEPLLQVPL